MLQLGGSRDYSAYRRRFDQGISVPKSHFRVNGILAAALWGGGKVAGVEAESDCFPWLR